MRWFTRLEEIQNECLQEKVGVTPIRCLLGIMTWEMLEIVVKIIGVKVDWKIFGGKHVRKIWSH